MSVMIRHKRRKSVNRKPSTAIEPTCKSIRQPELEAPDRGHLPREAPDAGEGRVGSFRREFTHGRSQN